MGKGCPLGRHGEGGAIGLAGQEPSGESSVSQEVPPGPSKMAVTTSVLDSGDLTLLDEIAGKMQVIPSIPKTLQDSQHNPDTTLQISPFAWK